MPVLAGRLVSNFFSIQDNKFKRVHLNFLFARCSGFGQLNLTDANGLYCTLFILALLLVPFVITAEADLPLNL